MAHESSNVYAKIIDLGTYLDAEPGTTAFLPLIANKGPDNKVEMITSPGEYVKTYGDEDIFFLGKMFREGPIVAKRYLAGKSSMYIMRVLPEDALYSNLIIYADVDQTTGVDVIKIERYNSLSSPEAIETVMTTNNEYRPILGIFAKYRGEWYNQFHFNFRPIANSDGKIILIDLARYNPQNLLVIDRSYTVSLYEDAVDLSGESVFIEHVLDFYDNDFTAKVNSDNVDFHQYLWTHEIDEFLKYIIDPSEAGMGVKDGDRFLIGDGATGDFAGHDKEIATYVADTNSWDFEQITELKYVIISSDIHDGTHTNLIANWDTNTNDWIYQVPVEGMLVKMVQNDPDEPEEVAYYSGLVWAKSKMVDVLDAIFTATNTTTDSTDYKQIGGGSSGSLIGANGKVDPATASNLLAKAYLGQIDPIIMSPEYCYFSLVWCPNYPRDVKDAAAFAAQYYYDYAILFTTISDVNDPDKAIEERRMLGYNNFKIALYNNFTLIRHDLTSVNIWVSPIVHMASVIPYNDEVGDISKAPYNFNRASLIGIKDMRYSLNQGDRDNLYLAQLNSVVKWVDGYTIWEALTTQVRHSALTDIPVVRVVLYIKKALTDFCRYFIAEDNVPETWEIVAKGVGEFMNRLVQEKMIMGYELDVGADEYERKTKKMHVNVGIHPKRFIEKIMLNLFIYA